MTATVNAIANQYGPVPVTLEASPQTIDLLSSTGHQATVNQLASLATTSPGVHQIAASPYVPVDASSLVDAGLEAELGLQVAQGTQVLDTVTHPPAASGGIAAARPPGIWFSDTALDAATLAQLQAAATTRSCCRAASVSSAPTNGSTRSPSRVTTAKGTSTGSVGLQQRPHRPVPHRASADPVLLPTSCGRAGPDVLREAQRHHGPGRPGRRAGGWPDDPVFVDALLARAPEQPARPAGHRRHPVDALSPATSCRGGCRLPPPPAPTDCPSPPSATERQRINGLGLAAPSARRA